MTEHFYIVAGHAFSVLADDGIDLSAELAHYAPFAADPVAAPLRVFRVRVVPEAALPAPQELVLEFDQDDEGSQIRLFRTPSGENWFEFLHWGRLSGKMLVSADFREASLSLVANGSFALGNALMVLYALMALRLLIISSLLLFLKIKINGFSSSRVVAGAINLKIAW